MTAYQKHQSSELNRLFKNKPYQGQNPEKAKVLFIGNDANYSDKISKHDFFKYIEEYHTDGVAFWKKYGVHHPFLLENYPFNKTKDGVKYHKSFSKLGFSSDYADKISFVELLGVATVGMISKGKDVFFKNVKQDHLVWLESIIFNDSPKIVFLPKGIYRNMLKLKKQYSVFESLPNIKISSNILQTIDDENSTRIVLSTHFSAAISNESLSCLRSTIDRFLEAVTA